MDNSSKIITGIIILICTILIISSFTFNNILRKKETPTTKVADVIRDKEIVDLDMTIEEKVGQLFIFGFWGTEPDYYITKMIQERYIGGVILLSYNVKSKEQLIELNRNLQSLSKQKLFISTDQEGGTVSRIKKPLVSEIIPQREISTYQEAYATARIRGDELKALGINMNFSPVVDEITNKKSFLYDRVFLENNLELSSGMIDGYNDSGIIPVPKHFPGHGNDSKDPHDTFSEITNIDIEKHVNIFGSLFQKSDVKALMIGHILVRDVDSDPASLSKAFVNDILRKRLKYEGITITDDMQMKALTKSYSIEEAVMKAFKAGNDILMFTGVPEEQALAYNTILDAVRNGTISTEEINQRVKRILSIKEKI